MWSPIISRPRPAIQILSPRLDEFPDELTDEPRWVCFSIRERGGKPTKVPIDPRTGGNADSTNPDTWATFKRAVKRYQSGNVDGVGFVLGDGWVGIDIDHCVTPDGTTGELALSICETLRTYGELSISGTGVHYIARGELPDGRRRAGPVEMYDSARYFTMSGHRLEGASKRVRYCPKALAKLHAEIFPAPKPEKKRKPRRPSPLNCRDDALLIRRLLTDRRGEKFRRLWAGDISDYDGDDSRADFALCAMLARHVGNDLERIDRLFRCSGLYRAKWERDDYRTRTVMGVLK